MQDTTLGENILGYQITRRSPQQCVEHIAQWIDSEESANYFVCANPHSLEVARDDSQFKTAIEQADLVVPDGVGIVIASRFLGGIIRDRVTGSDIFYGLSRLLNKQKKGRYFFLGASEETLTEIRARMADTFPEIEVVGTYSPPYSPEFTDEENKAMVEAINKSKADVLWVGMTAPKQEKWCMDHKDLVNVKVMGPIGAVFDFFTGKVKRSHPIFQRLGLEWLPRLLQEPRRLWRRNFISSPLFLYRIFVQKLSSFKKSSKLSV